MTNNPEIFLEVVDELGYDPMVEPPHTHTINMPGCVRCDLGAEEAKQSTKRKRKPTKTLVKK